MLYICTYHIYIYLYISLSLSLSVPSLSAVRNPKLLPGFALQQAPELCVQLNNSEIWGAAAAAIVTGSRPCLHLEPAREIICSPKG